MIKQRAKSKTYRLAAIVTILGVVEQNSSLLRDLLDPYYGVFVIGVGVAIAILREMTSESIDAK